MGLSKVIVGLWAGVDWWWMRLKLSINIGLVSLCFVQIYPSSVSKTLQSWSRALKVCHQTSLLPLCNVFYHDYERSLKLLEIDNISSVSKHEPKSSNKFFHFHLQMDVLIMFANKFVAAIIGSSFLVSWNLHVCMFLSCHVWVSEWIYTPYLPECQGIPCSKQAQYLKFKWLQQDSFSDSK